MKPMGLKIEDTRRALGGVSRATVYRMAQRGELDLIRIGGRSLITMQSIEARVNKAVAEAALQRAAA